MTTRAGVDASFRIAGTIAVVVTAAAAACASPNEPRVILEGVALDAPSSNPAGDWLVIDSETPPGLVIAGTSGGERSRLTTDLYHNDPAWSPSGSAIAYVDKSKGGLWLLDDPLGSPNPRQVVSGQVDLFDGCWSPDGDQVVFIGEEGLSLVHVGTGEVRTLGETVAPGVMSFPRWSPDGATILASRYPDLITIDVATGESSLVNGVQGHLAAWGPGEEIWLKGARAPQMLLRRLATGEVMSMDLGGRIRSVAVEPRSGSALIAVTGKGVAIVDRDFVEPRWVTHGEQDAPAAWVSNGCSVAFVRLDASGKARLVVVDIAETAGGTVRCN